MFVVCVSVCVVLEWGVCRVAVWSVVHVHVSVNACCLTCSHEPGPDQNVFV